MRVVMAQLNPIVGDLDGNKLKLMETFRASAAAGVDLVIFPELYLVGYPPKDLLERSWFIRRCQDAIAEIITSTAEYPQTGLIFGAPVPTCSRPGKGLFNAGILAAGGRLLWTQAKSLLPAYDVFDEARYFDPASSVGCADFHGETIGLSICEDAWNDPAFWPGGCVYDEDPIGLLVGHGATLLINISASPFHAGKEETRRQLIANHARRHARPFLYVNQVGANDELVFDGQSIAVDKEGRTIAICPAFAEHIQEIETGRVGLAADRRSYNRTEAIDQALVLGIKDYLRKTGFSRAIVGLSGGIDSALTCCLACQALGADHVLGISMPSPYSSRGSVEDSRQLAKNLGVEFKVIPINGIYRAYLQTLQPSFAGKGQDLTEENIQARIRGNILMAFSNKFGHLVLSTGNKSEMAVGYCTLYGDMSGGLSVLSDVPKTAVYELAEYINREKEIIPRVIIDKAPSAELRPGQKDQDTLPPYPILDGIIHACIEDGLSPEEIAALGYAPDTVTWVVKAIERSEYKRRQAAPGLRVTSKAFGAGRRMPIARKS